MRKTYCSVCGKMMNEKIDENSGKPFKIQMCSVSCINEAWHNVTEALKDTSVVVASYDIGDEMRGLIGVVGPTRMDYVHLQR